MEQGFEIDRIADITVERIGELEAMHKALCDLWQAVSYTDLDPDDTISGMAETVESKLVDLNPDKGRELTLERERRVKKVLAFNSGRKARALASMDERDIEDLEYMRDAAFEARFAAGCTDLDPADKLGDIEDAVGDRLRRVECDIWEENNNYYDPMWYDRERRRRDESNFDVDGAYWSRSAV
jgi:hypothetical protein